MVEQVSEIVTGQEGHEGRAVIKVKIKAAEILTHPDRIALWVETEGGRGFYVVTEAKIQELVAEGEETP